MTRSNSISRAHKSELLSPLGPGTPSRRPIGLLPLPKPVLSVPAYDDPRELLTFILGVLSGRNRKTVSQHLNFFLFFDFQYKTPEISEALTLLREHPEDLGYAVNSMVATMREVADMWIDSGKKRDDRDVDTPSARNVRDILPGRSYSLFKHLHHWYLAYHRREMGMRRDGSQELIYDVAHFRSEDLQWGLKIALENYGKRMAMHYFARLLNSPYSRHISRCDHCKSYFVYERARLRTVHHGVFCPKCITKGSAKRTQISRVKRLDTAARAWIEWESRPRTTDRRDWVANQVNKAHGTAFGPRWVSQNLKEILKRAEALAMARGKVKDRDGVFLRKDRPGQFYGSWVDSNGRRRKRKLVAHTLQQARALVNAEKARVEKQRTLGYAPPTRETFDALVPRYLQYQKPRLSQRSYERTSGMIENHLRPSFGTVRLGDIRRADIQQYITDRASKVSPASVTKELNCLKHLLGLAVEWELIPFNPALKIKAPRVPAGRVRYLQPTELRAVLAACPDWLRPIAALAAFTAMRRGEILNLRWLNVDIHGNRLMLAQTKNGDGRIVYLNELATDVIRCKWSENVKLTDRVFPLADDCTPDNISKGFGVVCRRLGIEDFRFHDLRHTAASWLRMQGADIHAVAQLLGHKDLRMAMRYQHLSPEFLGAAVGRLDAIFGEARQLPAETEGR